MKQEYTSSCDKGTTLGVPANWLAEPEESLVQKLLNAHVCVASQMHAAQLANPGKPELLSHCQIVACHLTQITSQVVVKHQQGHFHLRQATGRFHKYLTKELLTG